MNGHEAVTQQAAIRERTGTMSTKVFREFEVAVQALRRLREQKLKELEQIDTNMAAFEAIMATMPRRRDPMRPAETSGNTSGRSGT
jgi:hypothetical protein